MTTDQQELAAYQRAVETAKNELAQLRQRAELAEALALTLEKQRDQAEASRAALARSSDAWREQVLEMLADAAALNDSCQAWIEGEANCRRRAEQAEALALTLQAQRDQAEADNAVLRDGICRYAEAAPDARGALYHRLFVLTVAEHPGAALLTELALARAVVTALRMHHDAGGEVWHSIDADLAAYDATVRGRTG